MCALYRDLARAMRACNNNNMRNPSYYGLTHVIIVACSQCPHPLSCCIHTAYVLPSSPVLLHIYCTCFSTFWHCHSYIIQHFNGNSLVSLGLCCILTCKHNALCICVSHFAACGHVKCTWVIIRKWCSTTPKC